MVVGEAAIHNIMGGIENTGTVKQHNHKKKLRQRFDIIKKLGQGTFGKVQLGINKETGQEVAIKTIKKSKIESEADLVRIRREIQIMSSVQHPNIIHIYEVFENREKMVLVMEYAAGGELYDYLSERKVLDEEEARRIFRQIATACYYCHKHKICHRDLKLENILLDENNNAKIADFGLSNVFDDQRLLNTFCGSPLYASPEIVKGTPYHGPEVDCWSLGVLLYTLVYGAMPFDGSNFKRLVKQISQGDYFEPSKPSRASPLIREMLTVNPKHRADIEKICTHWWVNEGYNESCLDISEELANQTPVRLDVLLSLAPPPPQLESEKLMLTGEEESNKMENIAPTRSQSVGSLMELTHPSERRIMNLINDEKTAPKRKLETTISTDRANLDKRKDKIVKENTVADITIHGAIKENTSLDDASMSESIPLDRCSTQTISKEKMDIEPSELVNDPSTQGAACTELIEEAEKKKPVKVKKTLSTSISSKILEGINEAPSQENVAVNVDKENIEEVSQETVKKEEIVEVENKKPIKKKVATKKVLTDKNENLKSETEQPLVEQKPNATDKTENKDVKENESEAPSKPVERRKSRIFEAAEKFQNLISPAESKPMLTEKPKKVIIPGVSVDGFKKEFERKASLTQTPKPKPVSTKKESQENKVEQRVEKSQLHRESLPEPAEETEIQTIPSKPNKTDEEIKERERVRNAVSIISSALDKEGTRKSKSRPCMMRKPPVPFGVSGRSASGNIGIISPLSPPSGPKPFIKPLFDKREESHADKVEEENQTSSAELTLKSATLPRRKTSKAEITLKYPVPKPATMEFVTEMAHNVEAYQPPPTQRSEIVVPVSAGSPSGFRPNESKERIIPISFEKQESQAQEKIPSPPIKPPVPKPFQSQMSNTSQTSNLSRQSTQDSDSDTIASTGEPIKKSDREYIIPIAVEGGGYVTPRAGSLEPNESSSSSVSRSRTKFGRARRLNTFFNDRDSEDESTPFSSLHRHGSIGRDSDNEDSKKDAFHMHRLRSTRPERSTLEHADSISSGEEDDDEGFEILTAENLFSTLLSRVRDLTQRLNVDDNIRPGFPSSRLLSRFDHGTDFWNRIEHPLSRHSSLGRTFSRDRPISNSSTGNSFGVPWRRTVTRETPSNIDNVFQNSNNVSGQRPSGDDTSNEENLNLADLDLKKLKLSEEDALALSYLTPSLSRRIQKQLLSQLPPSEIKKLHRTLSANNPEEKGRESKLSRRSVDRISSTLPRKFSVDGNRHFIKDEPEKHNDIRTPKSFLPVKKEDYKPSYEFSLRSSSIGAEPRGDSKFLHYRPKIGKSVSLVEPKNYSLPKSEIQSSESSISESLSSSYRNNDSLDSSSKYMSDSSASRPCSKYSSDSYSRYVPGKSHEAASSVTSLDSNKTKKTPTNTKRISRFLRPDFFEVPQEESVYLKEKKEREMETQKVLKEIRDKRKTRLNMRRERSGSREKQLERTKYSPCRTKESEIKESDSIYNVSNEIKNVQETVSGIHDYENVVGDSKNSNAQKTEIPVKSEISELKTSPVIHDYVNIKAPEKPNKPKKETVSKIARPKSYPAESGEKMQTATEKESKISKLRKGFTKQSKEKTKEEKNETNKIINEEDRAHKNKLLQSIEKKLEKFRSNNTDKGTEESGISQEKKSTVESVIKRLREQSLPRNLEHCTESGLIKRAVSVEDLSSSAPLQTSRKSVTKILSLFKKYEEHDSKHKPTKKAKSKDSSKNKSSHKETIKDASSELANSNSNHNTADVLNANVDMTSTSESSQSGRVEKKERPRSLLFDKVRKFQNSYNSTKSDTVLNSNNNVKEAKSKSKLPVNNSFRRSLNLDNMTEGPKFYKNPSKNNLNEPEKRADRRNLKLDLSKIPDKSDTLVSDPLASANSAFESHSNENRNSLTTDDSSTILSPSDDYMSCDSWSVCSDLHHVNDLHSPLSPNGNMLYSGDENESVIDRIRRKSFYTRFNEKKRPRRPSSFRDSDLNFKTSGDYASLDRKSYEYRSPLNHRSSYGSLLQEPSKSYRPYTRSASLVNDYVNVPNHYQNYNSKISRPNSSLYGNFEEIDTLDDLLSTAKSKKYSSHMQPSRLGRTSVSPVNEYFVDHSSSSVFSPTNSEPI